VYGRPDMGSWIIIAILLAFLALAGWFAYEGWHYGDAPMSPHGYIALAIGIVMSLIVGVGLMALVFYSHRKGYDEPARRELDENGDGP
jgi:purine-cytosine permease-like protein